MPKSDFQERINKHGRDHIAGLANTARELWRKACEFDEIDPSSKFVVFSPENKFATFYNLAMGELFTARREYAAGGYVGLEIGKRNL